MGTVATVKVVGMLAGDRMHIVKDVSHGDPVLLAREPDNPHDSNAIGVWNATGTAQAGFVPRDRAAELAGRLGAESLEVLALWEWRDAEGRRCGLRILVAPPDALAKRPSPLLRG
jgi:hypothetical protein